MGSACIVGFNCHPSLTNLVHLSLVLQRGVQPFMLTSFGHLSLLGQVIFTESKAGGGFILPAVLFVISMVIFPLFVRIAFSSWNLSSPDGRQFNGFDNAIEMWSDPFYWNALKNMV